MIHVHPAPPSGFFSYYTNNFIYDDICSGLTLHGSAIVDPDRRILWTKMSGYRTPTPPPRQTPEENVGKGNEEMVGRFVVDTAALRKDIRFPSEQRLPYVVGGLKH